MSDPAINPDCGHPMTARWPDPRSGNACRCAACDRGDALPCGHRASEWTHMNGNPGPHSYCAECLIQAHGVVLDARARREAALVAVRDAAVARAEKAEAALASLRGGLAIASTATATSVTVGSNALLVAQGSTKAPPEVTAPVPGDPLGPLTDADRAMFGKLVAHDTPWDVAFDALLAARREARDRAQAATTATPATDSGNLIEECRRLRVRGDGLHGDPTPAWIDAGDWLCGENGTALLALAELGAKAQAATWTDSPEPGMHWMVEPDDPEPRIVRVFVGATSGTLRFQDGLEGHDVESYAEAGARWLPIPVPKPPEGM